MKAMIIELSVSLFPGEIENGQTARQMVSALKLAGGQERQQYNDWIGHYGGEKKRKTDKFLKFTQTHSSNKPQDSFKTLIQLFRLKLHPQTYVLNVVTSLPGHPHRCNVFVNMLSCKSNIIVMKYEAARPTEIYRNFKMT